MAYVSLPEISNEMNVWFSEEIGNRCFTALGDSITEDNMPKLPFVVIISSSVGVQSHDYASQTNGTMRLFDEFTIEFWLEPARHKRKDGSESPFWAYQDHMSLLEKLVSNMQKLAAEREAFFEFTGLNTSFVSGAVVFIFSFRQHISFCVTNDMFERPLEDFKFQVCATPFMESKCNEE